MIERYSRPEMAAIWTEEGKLDRWLAVEIAVVDAWAEAGRLPVADAEKVRKARYDIADVARYQAEFPVRTQADCRIATSGARPIVSGTKRKW